MKGSQISEEDVEEFTKCKDFSNFIQKHASTNFVRWFNFMQTESLKISVDLCSYCKENSIVLN